MKLYLLNALIMPYDGETDETAVFVSRKIDKKLYERIIRDAKQEYRDIISVFGHQSTVSFMHSILAEDIKQEIELSRSMINFDPGDIGLVVRVAERGENFQEWSFEELKEFYDQGKIEFYLISRVFSPELIMDPANYFAVEESNG